MKRNILPKYNLKDYIDELKLIHDDKYDYSLFPENFKMKTKYKIICKKHGVFEQHMYSHYKDKNGCAKCAYENLQHKYKDKKFWISEFKKVHGNKYTYKNNKDIKDSRSSITITCKYHGDFEQKIRNHRMGNGCPECALRYNYKDKVYKQTSCGNKKSYLYIFEFKNEDELFYKIGISVNPKHRIHNIKRESNHQYEIKIKYLLFDLIGDIPLIESYLHKMYWKNRYYPKIKFSGSKTECFNNIDHIHKRIKEYYDIFYC